MRWLFYGGGVLFGVLVALLANAVALIVCLVHLASFAFCALGLHGIGHLIRRDMTTPVLEWLRALCADLQQHARKKSGL